MSARPPVCPTKLLCFMFFSLPNFVFFLLCRCLLLLLLYLATLGGLVQRLVSGGCCRDCCSIVSSWSKPRFSSIRSLCRRLDPYFFPPTQASSPFYFFYSLSLYLSSHKTTFVLLFLFQAPFPSSVALLLLLCTTTTPYEKAAKKQSWLPKNFFPLLLLLLLSLSPLLLLLHRAAFGMGVRTHVHSAALTAAASITRILL